MHQVIHVLLQNNVSCHKLQSTPAESLSTGQACIFNDCWILQVHNYPLQGYLGGGADGTVHLARLMQSGACPPADLKLSQLAGMPLVAYKEFDNMCADAVESMMHEASVMARINSLYVVQFYGVVNVGGEKGIVMEYCAGGSLLDETNRIQKEVRI